MSYRNLVIAALLLLVVGGGLAIWNAGKAPQQKEAAPVEATGSDSEVVGKNVSFIITEGEVKKWKLDAVKAVYNENQTTAHLNDVKGTFFNKEGKPVLNFTAPEGEYASKNNQVVLKGGVIAKATQQDGNNELHAPQMSWDAKAKEVVATGGIELLHDKGKSIAQTCRFDLDFSHISLEGGVTSTVTSP